VDLKVAHFQGSIRLEPDRLTIQGRAGSTGDLLAALYRFFDANSDGTKSLAVR
jgi:hypothetical protein